MNAHALLTSQGWLGTGHALDSRLTDYGAPTYKQKGHRGLAYDPSQLQNARDITLSSGNGLVKPLLVSQRHDSKRGIGKKAHEPQSGNQWWLKGFQSALDNIGKSESERTSANNSGYSTPVGGARYVGKHAGLYGYFVKGQLMRGTLDEDVESERSSKKRKSDVLDDDKSEGQGRDPLASSPVKSPQTTKELETSVPYLEERDKNRRSVDKRAPSTDVEQFATVGQFLGAVKDVTKQEKKKKWKSESLKQADEADRNLSSDQRPEETKEERKARRRRRKEEKQNRELTLAEMVEEELAKLNSMDNTSDQTSDAENADEKAKRKAERRRRKMEEKAKSEAK